MVDKLLGGLFGGQDDTNDATASTERANDFLSRYQQGQPWENISGEEAIKNYKGVVQQLTPDQYEDAASEALSRLSPEQRRQFAGFLQQGTGGQIGADTDDPRQLAQLTNQARQSDTGLGSLFGGGSLDDLLGGGLGGALGGLLGGGGSGGANDLLGGLFGGGQSKGTPGQGSGGLNDLLDNPIVKSVLAGIAAIAIGKMAGGKGGGSQAAQPSTPQPAPKQPDVNRPDLPGVKKI